MRPVPAERRGGSAGKAGRPARTTATHVPSMAEQLMRWVACRGSARRLVCKALAARQEGKPEEANRRVEDGYRKRGAELLASVIVDAATHLFPQPPGFDVLDQQRAGPVFLAEAVVK